MERNAMKVALIGFALLMSACADGEDNGAGDETSGPDLGSESGSSTGPQEPPATSASATQGATMTTTTDDPSDDSGSSSGEPAGGCAEYCSIYLDACPDFAEYANEQHCMEHCAQWPVGSPGDTMGDSLGCRTYHVTVASTTDPNLHCPHAGPSGDHTCVAEDAPTCDLYCTRYFTYCTGDLNLWESMDACLGECAHWYPGTIEDTVGHTIGCRAYYANLAQSEAELNCANAGPGGGDQCVLGLGG